MKIFFIVGVFICVVQSSPAQDKEQFIRIAPPVGRFFLEESDRAAILAKKDSLQTIELNNLNLVITNKDSIIQTYKTDSTTCRQYLSVKDQDIDLYKSELKKTKREVVKQKTLKILTMIGAGIVIIIFIL